MLTVGFILIGIGIGRAVYLERKIGKKEFEYVDSFSSVEVSDTTEA